MQNACKSGWRPAQAPDVTNYAKNTGHLRACEYCGSMPPDDLAAAIRAGAKLDPADRKYGWPHKFYVRDVPNPHAGLLESRMGSSHAVPICPTTGNPCASGEQSFGWPVCECMRERPESVTLGRKGDSEMTALPNGFSSTTGRQTFTWAERGKPADVTTWGKFYTVHLKDATPDDRTTIEAAMGLKFEFLDGGRVSWQPL